MRVLTLATPVLSMFEDFKKVLENEINNHFRDSEEPTENFIEGDHFDSDMGFSSLYENENENLDGSTKRQLAGGKCVYNYRDLKKWKSLSCSHECDGTDRQSPLDLPRMGNNRFNPAKMSLEIDWNMDDLLKCYWSKPKKNSLGQKHTLNSGCKALCVTFKREELNNGNPVKYCVAQVHMHVPSENTRDGQHSHGDLHFVHVPVEGQINFTSYLVVSMFVDIAINGESEWSKKWIVEKNVDGEYQVDWSQSNLNNADWASLKGEQGVFNGNFWVFKGSLTTPPCTEAVEWIVLTKSIKISTEQYTAYHNMFNAPENKGKIRSTARYTQNSNNKSTIYYGKLVNQGGKIMGARGSSGASQISVTSILMAILALCLW